MDLLQRTLRCAARRAGMRHDRRSLRAARRHRRSGLHLGALPGSRRVSGVSCWFRGDARAGTGRRDLPRRRFSPPAAGAGPLPRVPRRVRLRPSSAGPLPSAGAPQRNDRGAHRGTAAPGSSDSPGRGGPDRSRQLGRLDSRGRARGTRHARHHATGPIPGRSEALRVRHDRRREVARLPDRRSGRDGRGALRARSDAGHLNEIPDSKFQVPGGPLGIWNLESGTRAGLTPRPPPIKCARMASYLPILVMGVLAAALPLGTIILARVIQTRRPNPAKAEPYECGVDSPTTAFDTRFSVRYFLIAVLFVIFDVETIFLFPWAVMFHRLGLFGLIEMLIFLVILVIGYFYVWKRKALDWA